MEPHRNMRFQTDAGNAARAKGGRIVSASATLRFGVWIRVKTRGSKTNGWNPYDRVCVNVDRCWESDSGAGVCRDLHNPTGKSSKEHHASDCEPGYAEVVVGGTHKICRSNWSFGYEGIEGQGCKGVNEWLLLGGNAACVLGTST